VILSLLEHPDGVDALPGRRVVYDLARDEAHFGAAAVDGPALVWELGEQPVAGATLAAEIDVAPDGGWLLRCDRVDFPPGGVAYRHTHPGPGIRYLLAGSLRVEAGGGCHLYRPGGAWFESGPEPVLAVASETQETAFVRVMLVPRALAGKRTIRYVDPADEARPKLQRARIYLEQPIEL